MRNLADDYPSLLEELSMEEIIARDPDYIFVTIMGSSTQKAMDALAESLQSNPAWEELSAVKIIGCLSLMYIICLSARATLMRKYLYSWLNCSIHSPFSKCKTGVGLYGCKKEGKRDGEAKRKSG